MNRLLLWTAHQGDAQPPPQTFSAAKIVEYWAEDLAVTSALASWADRSGNGRHLVQAVEADKPSVDITSHAGGRKRVTFTAADTEFLQTASFGGVQAQPLTVFAVIDRDTHPADGAVYKVWDGIDATNRCYFDYQNTVPDAWRLGATTAQSHASIEVAATAKLAAVITYNGASSKSNIDGTEITVAATTGTAGIDGITMGTIWSEGSQFFNGGVYYFCAIAAAATAADKTAFFNWAYGCYGSNYGART